VAHREPFNIGRPLVAATAFIFAGDKYEKGDPFPRLGNVQTFNRRLIRQQYEARKVNHVPEEDVSAPDGPVTMKASDRKNSFIIAAPWLDKPETVRGKVNAEKRFAEVQEEGPPLGWIEGGSEVTVEAGNGGWYTVNAPWLEAPERLQGREAAEARQLELHEAGAPEEEADDPLEVLLTQHGDTFDVAAPWIEEPETFDDEEAAKARQAELTAAGPPEGWEPPAAEDTPDA
jgi:hypothetical protein